MRFFSFLIAAVSAIFASLGLNAAPVPRSVSTSRQFVVYGPDARLRGGVCDLAERTKKSALNLLQQADSWDTPIVISAEYAQANHPEFPPVRLNVSQTGFGLKIQLDLRIGPDPSGPAIEREVLRSVFLEIMYRNETSTSAGTFYIDPPHWLVEGTLALTSGLDASGTTEALGASVASGDIQSLEQLVRQDPGRLESPLRAVYRAYAAALVLTLTERPDCRLRFLRFLQDLPRVENDPVAAFRAHFPGLGENPEALEKTWTLSITGLAASNRFQLLACEETERELAKVLQVSVGETGGRAATYTLEEFPKFVHLPSSGSALSIVRGNLVVLSGRANPLYRPVIAEYQQITALLARARVKKIPERLATIRATREHISRRMNAIGDYMNWYEATQSGMPSGAFGGFLEAAERAGKGERRRRDPVSLYLDALEAQLQN